jgi:endoglycosylceramidase
MFAAIIFSASALMAQASRGQVYSSSATDKFIYDSDGRVSLFHGENFVQKGFPWYPEVLLDVENIKAMKSWGWNTIRLGVMWTGVEPEMGVYNETYVDVMSGILDDLEAHGIHAIIDVHQDVISSFFCLYDGAPKWLINLSDTAEHEFPWPLAWDGENPCPGDRAWGKNYLSEEAGAAFQDLYDNHNGMRDHFNTFWTKIVTAFKNKSILGYEIINEPFPGNIYKQPSLLLPGVAGSQSLQPFYDIIGTTIHENDPDHIVFYEPVTWGMILNGTVTGSGFMQVPGGEKFRDKSVFSFHYYCWWFTEDGGDLQKVTCDKAFGPKVFSQVDEDISRLGGSAMLTEWGQGCMPDSEWTAECDPIMDLADEHLLSWTDWYWTGSLMNGWNPSDLGISTYSRTYAQYIAGMPTKMKYDDRTKAFQLCYVVNTEIVSSAPTVIYANRALHYADGLFHSVSGSMSAHMTVSTRNPDENIVTVSFNANADAPLPEARDVCIRLFGKQ